LLKDLEVEIKPNLSNRKIWNAVQKHYSDLKQSSNGSFKKYKPILAEEKKLLV
jgi:hypothetical protein